jgi:hypothetical protein
MRALVVLLSLTAALAAVAASTASPPAVAGPASRVLDRTMLCATGLSGGIREVQADAYAGVRRDKRWLRMPYAAITTGQISSGENSLANTFAWITSGRPDAESVYGDEWFTAKAVESGTLGVNRRSCRVVSRTIPLTRKGLTGGAAGPFGDAFDCTSPKRVLVRVRALFAVSATLRAQDVTLRTTVPVRQATVAVRTEKGRPLALVTTAETGRTTVFTGKGCIPD